MALLICGFNWDLLLAGSLGVYCLTSTHLHHRRQCFVLTLVIDSKHIFPVAQ